MSSQAKALTLGRANFEYIEADEGELMNEDEVEKVCCVHSRHRNTID